MIYASFVVIEVSFLVDNFKKSLFLGQNLQVYFALLFDVSDLLNYFLGSLS